jgi:hypothetical protein
MDQERTVLELERKDKSFIPPRGACSEAFQSLFSHIDGKIRDGYGEVGTERLILTQHSPYLCDGVGKPLKKTHTWSGVSGVRTRDLPNVKWRARRLATVLGLVFELAMHY